MDTFYANIEKAQEIVNSCEWKIIIGDFNAKIGERSSHEKDVLGPFGYGIRNQRGGRLIRFCRANQLVISNTFFKKKLQQKWTWSLDQKAKNEIDFILTQHKSCLKNVESLIDFKFSTDHRMVRLTFQLKHKTKLTFHKHQLRIKVNPGDSKTIMEFNQVLKRKLSATAEQTDYRVFQNELLSAANVFRTRENQHPILTAVTKKMIEDIEFNYPDFQERRKKQHIKLSTNQFDFTRLQAFLQDPVEPH